MPSRPRKESKLSNSKGLTQKVKQNEKTEKYVPNQRTRQNSKKKLARER